MKKMFFLFIGLMLLSGCWDRIEMNDMAFFMASALDLTNKGELKTSILVPIAAGAGGGESSSTSTNGTLGKTYVVFSATGTNLHDTERKVQEKMSRHFFKGHRRVVFIGEGLARKGIKDILDYYARDPGSRLRTFIVVAKGNEASKLLKTDHPIERIPSEEVRELERAGVGTSVTMRDFMMMQAEEGIVPVTGAIELVPPTGQSNFTVFSLSSTAVFKDYKLVGYLNNNETRSLRWIKEETKQEFIGTTLPHIGGNVGVILNDMKSKFVTNIKGNKATVRIDLDASGVLHEANVDMNISRNTIGIIEKELGHFLKDETFRTVRKTQSQLKSDVFGIGLQLHRHNYETWKRIEANWDDIYANAEIIVNVKIHLKRAGVVSNSIREADKR
ncbi:hypothetical protein SY83_19915 [Paenibacillus swuensis]|uniref:Uncharacterized protein n=1 Tax=Paenibacillus swuensis TaxID=1178515 RepID=A0A172TN54_9BACL|nr:Ger(x)C family spore germination protein [Paenibacillus swuensis]ANE48183.1 hypothetical protein SY83_19915 [Paenibacillus swuensis]